MTPPQEILLYFYNLTLIPVIFFSLLFLLFAFLNLFVKEKDPRVYSGKYPFISVQIPVYNDRIATKCVDSCLAFDYPKDRYEIIIADDSTDKTTARLLKGYSRQYPGLVRYFHRDNRDGFKPGALMNVMRHTKGEIIVLFDSDWKPQKDFLKKIITPMMEDRQVAMVQAKQAFTNLDTNLVSRFAGYLLMIYHSTLMPINNKFNTVFFCGTAGAIRRDVLEEAGGWNVGSITEDADLSVRIIGKGYKTEYLDLPVPSEVPTTIEGFVRQQMRWSYGLTRAFIDNISLILFSRKMKLSQRIIILYTTLGNIVAPFVILMTIFGMCGWFIGEPELFQLSDITEFLSKFAYTSGFIVMGLFSMLKENKIKDLPYLLLGTFSVSLVLVAFNSLAFYKAVRNKPLFWWRTPKEL